MTSLSLGASCTENRGARHGANAGRTYFVGIVFDLPASLCLVSRLLLFSHSDPVLFVSVLFGLHMLFRFLFAEKLSSSSSCCPSFSAPGSFGAQSVEVELGEISAAEAHLDMVSTSLFGEPTVVGFAGGSDVWSWRLSLDLDVPSDFAPLGWRRGMRILQCFLRLGPCGFPPDSLTLGGPLWGVYPSLIVNAAADTTGLEVGTTDDLAALEELSWNSVSLFLDADDTVGSCGLLSFFFVAASCEP